VTTAALPLPALRRRKRNRWLSPGPVAWTTVAVLAALMAYADGFVLTALEGAVGLTQQLRGPFRAWLESSTLMLPVFVLAVLVSLAFVRHRSERALTTPRRVVAAALFIAIAGGVVGTGEVIGNLAYDYHLQSEHLAAKAASHGETAVAPAIPSEGVTGTGAPAGHVSLAAQQQQQRDVVQHAARLGSAAVLGVNVVLVGWYLAFRGGRLERRRQPALPHPAE
jgi:hypothetical protein